MRNFLVNILIVVVLVGALAGVARLDQQLRWREVEKTLVAKRGLQNAPGALIDHALPAAATNPARPPSAVKSVPQRKSVLDLQAFKRSESATISNGTRTGSAQLIHLNPNINAWMLLSVDWGGGARRLYHLENREPKLTHVKLIAGGEGIQITRGGTTKVCDVWSGATDAFDRARATELPYAPVCGGQIYVRNVVSGAYTDIERVTEFLRDNVWSGEDIVGFVRDTVYQDAYRETGSTAQANEGDGAASRPDAPPAASVAAAAQTQAVSAPNFGINVEGPASRHLALGRWYPVRDGPGIYASMMRPGAVSEAIVAKDRDAVNALDAVESSALVLLTSFDLSQFEVRYAVGTDNPGVGWSFVSKRGAGPGPDGFATPSPVVPNGMASPGVLSRIAGTFSGGFKRDHGAFPAGEFAKVNNASHYGFVEQGVVLSTLHPGLSTLYALDDGSVHMETWTKEKNALLSRVQSARQNGVPLIVRNGAGEAVPGPLVKNWGGGNWSSSLDSQLRTLRAGACIVEAQGREFLLHAVFSTATPSAMALVFHAYGCRYAMLLDMNALEHAYLALYVKRGDQLVLEHPFYGMTDADRTSQGRVIPRFVGFPDNRDFFYVLRRANRK